MNLKAVFIMPKVTSITARTSSITNAFVNGIIPAIVPTEEEIEMNLNLLGLDYKDLRCAYCGDKSTEWDHLRPIVKDKKPTGYMTDIYNLVPACGKCNQSKGNKDWHTWMVSGANLSPKTRGIKDLDNRIEKIKAFERWKEVSPLKFEELVDVEVWNQHWQNCEAIHLAMIEYQKHAVLLKEQIEKNYKR